MKNVISWFIAKYEYLFIIFAAIITIILTPKIDDFFSARYFASLTCMFIGFIISIILLPIRLSTGIIQSILGTGIILSYFLNMSDKIIYNGIAWLIIILVPIGIISGLLAGCYTYRHIEEVLNNSKLSQIRNDVDILKIRRRYASNRFVSVYLSIFYSIPIILIYRISIGILLTSI